MIHRSESRNCYLAAQVVRSDLNPEVNILIENLTGSELELSRARTTGGNFTCQGDGTACSYSPKLDRKIDIYIYIYIHIDMSNSPFLKGVYRGDYIGE